MPLPKLNWDLTADASAADPKENPFFTDDSFRVESPPKLKLPKAEVQFVEGGFPSVLGDSLLALSFSSSIFLI